MGKGRFRRFVGVVCIQYTQVWDRKKMKQGYWILLLTVFLLFIFSHHGFVTTWQGSCNFANCTFAHGEHELRGVSRGSTNKFEFHCRHCLSWQFICMNPGRLSSDKDFSVEVFFLGGSRFFMKRCRSLWCQSCMSGFTGNRWLQFWRNHQIWLRRRVVSHGQICKNINANQLKWYEMKSHLKPDWWNEMAADHKQSTVNVDLRHTDEVCLCSAISAFSASSFNLFNSFQVFSKNHQLQQGWILMKFSSNKFPWLVRTEPGRSIWGSWPRTDSASSCGGHDESCSFLRKGHAVVGSRWVPGGNTMFKRKIYLQICKSRSWMESSLLLILDDVSFRWWCYIWQFFLLPFHPSEWRKSCMNQTRCALCLSGDRPISILLKLGRGLRGFVPSLQGRRYSNEGGLCDASTDAL